MFTEAEWRRWSCFDDGLRFRREKIRYASLWSVVTEGNFGMLIKVQIFCIVDLCYAVKLLFGDSWPTVDCFFLFAFPSYVIA
jgi:hypothetical protein